MLEKRVGTLKLTAASKERRSTEMNMSLKINDQFAVKKGGGTISKARLKKLSIDWAVVSFL